MCNSSITHTPEQENIFEFLKHEKGNGIIDAVAGAGKTYTILECSKIIPKDSKALFCAFNKGIVLEIEQKLKESNSKNVEVNTIHSLGHKVLRKHMKFEVRDKKYEDLIENISMRKELFPYYEKIIATNYKTSDKEKYRYKIDKHLLEMINKLRETIVKNYDELSISELKEKAIHYDILENISFINEGLPEYFEALKILLKAGNTQAGEGRIIDFSDMLYLHHIWNLEPTETYDYLFIDECQDLSLAQRLTVNKFLHPDSRLIAVGDPYQAINGFAGADNDSFERIRAENNAITLPLTVTFRCPECVVEKAKEIRPDIRGTNKAGEVSEVNMEDLYNLVKPGDLIISRRKEPLTSLLFSLLDKSFNVYFGKSQANAIRSYLKSLFEYELKQILPNNKLYINKLFDEVKKRNEEKIINDSKRESNDLLAQKSSVVIDDIYKLDISLRQIKKQLNSEKVETINEAIERLYVSISEKSKSSIEVKTIHRAKGLENDRVFVLEYDKLPLSYENIPDWQKAQEENLKYVALTRAKNELFLVQSEIPRTNIDVANDCVSVNKKKCKIDSGSKSANNKHAHINLAERPTTNYLDVKVGDAVVDKKGTNGIVERIVHDQPKETDNRIYVLFSGDEKPKSYFYPKVFSDRNLFAELAQSETQQELPKI